MSAEAKVCVGTNPNSLVAQGLDFKGLSESGGESPGQGVRSEIPGR